MTVAEEVVGQGPGRETRRVTVAEEVVGQELGRETRRVTVAEEVVGQELGRETRRVTVAEEVVGQELGRETRRVTVAEEVVGQELGRETRRVTVAEEVVGQGPGDEKGERHDERDGHVRPARPRMAAGHRREIAPMPKTHESARSCGAGRRRDSITRSRSSRAVPIGQPAVRLRHGPNA
ncbi:hypothetical protein [Pseudosporangium ferrugineum]|uniref:hypothetical protein n=1 Tax=Pseudosporangium ferrugineum TaxID=439699 RepID=UPI000D07BF6A|nr:hypothetical protein [Pseudosporangium ferrugineum]